MAPEDFGRRNPANGSLLTCVAFSDGPFVTQGSEELGGFRSASARLTSGTNSFCNDDDGGGDDGQKVAGIKREAEVGVAAEALT